MKLLKLQDTTILRPLMVGFILGKINTIQHSRFLNNESAEADIGGAENFCRTVYLCKIFEKLIPQMAFTMQMKWQYTFILCHIVHTLKSQKGCKEALKQQKSNIPVKQQYEWGQRGDATYRKV